MWKKVLTTCPVQGSGGTTTLCTFPLLVMPSEGPKDWRFEYRDAWTRLFARDLTAADRQNGLQFHGLALLSGSLYRFAEEGGSSPWRDGVSRKAADTLRPRWERHSEVP